MPRAASKKDFFQSGEKCSQEFLKLRQQNLNLTMPKSYHELIKASESDVPCFYLPKEQLEDAILNYRDICTKGNINLEQKTQIKQGGIQERRENIAEDRSRARNLKPATQGQQIPAHEGMTHYQG